MSIKKYLFSFLLVFSVSAFAQSWQSKPVVRIEDAGQSFLYTFNDSSNAYINKCNVSYIVNLPNSQWVQVGYQYDGSTSRIITASYSAIIQPDLGSAKELSDTLNAWLRDCASASGIPSGLADSLSDIRKYVDSLVFFYPDSSTITQYDVINSLNTPPGSPVTGDTYLVGNSPTGAWVGHAKDIAEWNGSAWVFTDAVQGDFLYNATNLFTYIFRNGNWVQTSGIPALNNGNTISSGLKIGTDNARSLTFETNNVNRGRIDSIGRFHIYNLPTSATADSFVILGNTLGNFTKQGKSTFLDGIGGGGGGGVALSDITAATAAHTINNAAFQQEWKWDSLGSGIGLKISTASTAATANTQVLMELRKTSQTPANVGGYESTLLNVINEDNNPAYVMKAAHFEAKDFAATFGKSGIGTGYGNVAILGNSKLHFLHNGVQSAYIYRLYNAPILHIVPPPEGSVNIGTGSLNMISFDKGAVAGNSFMGVGYSSTTKQTQVFGGDPYLGYRAASTHAGVIENESGVLKFSANTGLLGGYNNFTPTWQLVLHGANNNVGVGTLTPNTSAKLDVSSTTQGFAPPEMTATQASAISTTTRKLIIYVTDTNGTFTSAGLWMWNGTTWKLILAE